MTAPRLVSRALVAVVSLVLLFLSAVARAGSGAWERAGLAGENVSSLVVDPASPGTLYAVTVTGVFRTMDGGAAWTRAGRGLPEPPLGAFSLQISSSGLFAATSLGLYKSVDRGDSWRLVRSFARNHSYQSFAMAGSIVYLSDALCQLVRFECNWKDGTLWRSSDGGSTWSPAGISGDVVRSLAIDPSSPTTVFAGANGPDRRGLYKSTDGGNSFSSVAGLTGSSVSGIAVSAVSPSTVYASLETGIFRSRDGGASWESAERGLPDVSIALALDPKSADTLYAVTGRIGVFRTTDAGDHWLQAGPGLPASSATDVAIDPSSPSTLYAGTAGDGIYKMEVPDVTPCAPGPTALCLNAGRFRVEVGWLVSRPLDARGAGQAVPLTGDTGAFWFFSASNLELMVKVLDGRGVNGHFWFFWGALSDVSYTITATDTRTGQVKTYTNPQGRLESRADIEAF